MARRILILLVPLAAALTASCQLTQPDRTPSAVDPYRPLQETKFLPLAEKPETVLVITWREAAAFWARVLPPNLREINQLIDAEWSQAIDSPEAPSSSKGDEADQSIEEFSDADFGDDGEFGPDEMSAEAKHPKLSSRLHRFKQQHAHEFWEPYRGKRITVHGIHHCPCCFYAAIGYLDSGHRGWTIRLDAYIAIGLPQGGVCYSPEGRAVAMKSGCLLPYNTEFAAQAVGVVDGPFEIEATRNTSSWLARRAALAYFVLESADSE